MARMSYRHKTRVGKSVALTEITFEDDADHGEALVRTLETLVPAESASPGGGAAALRVEDGGEEYTLLEWLEHMADMLLSDGRRLNEHESLRSYGGDWLRSYGRMVQEVFEFLGGTVTPEGDE